MGDASPSDYRSIKIPDLAATLGASTISSTKQTSTRELAELLDTPVQPQVAARIAELRARSEAYLDAALS